MEVLFNLFLISLGVLALLSLSLGVLFLLTYGSLLLKEKQLEVEYGQFEFFLKKAFTQGPNQAGAEEPSELAQRIEGSKSHPEVAEIEDSDTIIGVRFVAPELPGIAFPGSTYPPVFEDEEDDVESL